MTAKPGPAGEVGDGRPAARASRVSTVSGAGWNASQVRKSRTESRPLAAIRAKSAATSSGSKLDHQRHRGASRPVVDADPEARVPTRRGLSAVIGAPARRAPRPAVDGEVVVDHPLGIEPLFDRRAHRRPSSPADVATAPTASSSESTRKPFSPSRISSGIDPRARAITGVPHAIASTTLKPNGSSKLIRCSSARAPPSSSPALVATDRPEVRDLLAVERGSTNRSKYSWSWTIPAISSGMPARSATSIASAVPLSGWILPEEQEVVPRRRGHRELVHVDAVVDRRDVLELSVPVGVADRDVVAALACTPRRPGTIRSDENPWIVVIDRRVDQPAVRRAAGSRSCCGSGRTPRRARTRWRCAGPPRPSRPAPGPPNSRSGQCRPGVADVSESAVANSVTSTPRSTSPSVRSETNCSHGP